jgi:hypothetical protein
LNQFGLFRGSPFRRDGLDYSLHAFAGQIQPAFWRVPAVFQEDRWFEKRLVPASTAKKVIVRRFDRENLIGYVNPLSYLQPQGLELLKPDGALALVPYDELKSVSFVRDFETEADPARVFLTRPKLEGLWARMVFRDGEVMDGVLPNNLLSWDVAGFTVTPPESDSNNQRVFVPRQALKTIQILGVVGSPLRSRRRKEPSDQPTLF